MEEEEVELDLQDDPEQQLFPAHIWTLCVCALAFKGKVCTDHMMAQTLVSS